MMRQQHQRRTGPSAAGRSTATPGSSAPYTHSDPRGRRARTDQRRAPVIRSPTLARPSAGPASATRAENAEHRDTGTTPNARHVAKRSCPSVPLLGIESRLHGPLTAVLRMLRLPALNLLSRACYSQRKSRAADHARTPPPTPPWSPAAEPGRPVPKSADVLERLPRRAQRRGVRRRAAAPPASTSIGSHSPPKNVGGQSKLDADRRAAARPLGPTAATNSPIGQRPRPRRAGRDDPRQTPGASGNGTVERRPGPRPGSAPPWRADGHAEVDHAAARPSTRASARPGVVFAGGAGCPAPGSWPASAGSDRSELEQRQRSARPGSARSCREHGRARRVGRQHVCLNGRDEARGSTSSSMREPDPPHRPAPARAGAAGTRRGSTGPAAERPGARRAGGHRPAAQIR